jgi:hypothetical protein
MAIDKLDLLAKGWKASEIEHASKILEEAEGDKDSRTKTIDKLLFLVLGILMIGNGCVSAYMLAPFIYALNTNFIIIIASLVGFIFSILLTIIIYDIEKIHKKHEINLFIAFIANGVINFYLILEFTARFGAQTKLPLTSNIYLIAGTYLVTFLVPQIVYQIRKKTKVQADQT